MNKWVKTSFVMVGATVLSTIAIQASDLLSGQHGNLLGLVGEVDSVCGPGATQLNLSVGTLCVDKYEAAPAPACPQTVVTSAILTQENLNEPKCAVVSTSDATAWRYVSLAQAQQLCARSGKRLPTAEEWYAVAAAQADQSTCVLSAGGPERTGVSDCKTASGIYDVVGNVWEWVDGQVTDGQLRGRTVPEEGYVSLVDTAGLVLETAAAPVDEYGSDYAKTNTSGVYGIIRGGFYGSKTDGGIFAQNLAVPLDLKADGIGFRCVRSVN